MANPTIEELQNSDRFELVARLKHTEIKNFVIEQISKTSSTLVKVYMFYQLLMVLTGMFFLARAIVFVFRNYYEPFLISALAIVFSLSFLIVVHEALHGAALKLTGAKHVAFGGYLKKFIFYAEADRHVLNRKQFAFIALTPLIVVKIITLAGIILFLNQPLFYFFLIVMSAHSLFCAGDIGLLSVFYDDTEKKVYTFDLKDEKTSYFYKQG
ncbi:MAG TPA: DUF3267 domain-containing protein [Tangfeifania sp.]|nr:DUF3267 domain-containing protein [Tangfeifania sp.]